jgi:predicted transcriptional regulator
LTIILLLFLPFISYSEKKEILKIADQSPKFFLKDAADKEYNFDKIIGKGNESVQVLILIIGDQSTRKSGNQWARELDKLYKEKKEVALFMIADLRGLPFFVTESMVKWGTKKENLPIPILLDWGGKISELYKTQKGESNLFIIDQEGKIKYCYTGKCTQESVKALNVKIQENLKEKKTP